MKRSSLPSWHRIVLLIAVLCLAGLSLLGERHYRHNDSLAVAARFVPLYPDRPGVTRIGALRYLGGWELQSYNSDFGGFSALGRLPDGRLLAIGDQGRLMAFRFAQTPKGARVSDVEIRPLPGSRGRGADGKRLDYSDRDSEALARDVDGRRFWVGYENKSAIRRFGPRFDRVEAIRHPREMADWPANGGAEALLRLADGRFLLFAEAAEAAGVKEATQALIFAGDPARADTRITRFSYRPPEDYRITDGTQLPDGRLLLLHRRFSLLGGFSCILSLADPADIAPGAVLTSRPIAHLTAPLSHDNFEGVFAERESGRTVIWLISDDNNNALQRTLLMKFLFDPRAENDASGGGMQSVSKPEPARPGFR